MKILPKLKTILYSNQIKNFFNKKIKSGTRDCQRKRFVLQAEQSLKGEKNEAFRS